MTIIVFLVDTSASMQQRSWVSGRSTFLDVAKGAVEFFVKLRQKSPESRGDRYMLLTFEEFPKNIKAGWKENLQTFMTELKNLEASGMTTMGTALKQVFDILNINRMQTGIDMYGQGRYPFYLEPAVILVISDGGKLTTQGSVQSELNLPMHSSVPGSELTREPFRWDQRLYALVLRMAGTPPAPVESGHVASDLSSIDAMCEVTGGRSYSVVSQRMLHQCIDSLVQKLQSGVVIHFEKVGPDPPAIAQSKDDDEAKPEVVLDDKDVELLGEAAAAGLKDGGGGSDSRPLTPNPILATNNVSWHSCRRLIYVPRSAQKGFAVGFWPLPEAFWPDVSSPALPQRSAHPNIKFTCSNQEPMIIDNLPFDKYELEPSPLTLYILARKQPNVCWQVFIQGSSKSSDINAPYGAPFGYLKASTKLLTVNLFVLPYNYPVLLPLLEDLFKLHRLKPTTEWRTQFNGYLRTMPAYYAGPLRRVLTRMGAGNLANSLIPETLDNCLSYSALQYLKRLKNQAKVEFDKTLAPVAPNQKSRGAESIRVIPRSHLNRDLLTSHLMKDKFQSLKEQITDYPGFSLSIKDNIPPANGLRNPFDTDRTALLDQIIRMRSNFLQPSTKFSKLIDDDTKHTMPIAQMGNYQDHLKRMPTPLREIESTPVRQHMFGNPFKISKNMIMDEVVLDEVSLVQNGQPVSPAGSAGGMSPKPGGGGKRGPEGGSLQGAPPSKRLKKGPLPKEYVYRGSAGGLISPPLSPLPEDRDESPASSPNPHHVVENETPVTSVTPVAPAPPVMRQQQVAQPPLAPVTKPHQQQQPQPSTKTQPPPPDKSQNHNLKSNVIKKEEVTSSPVKPASKAASGQQQRPPPHQHQHRPQPQQQQQQQQVKRERDVGKDAQTQHNSASAAASKEEIMKIKAKNNHMKPLIFKEVKRPGRNYDRLMTLLKEIQGPINIKEQFVLEVVREASRFKRTNLAEYIVKNMECIVASKS